MLCFVGIIPLYCANTIVLFDSGASHSFVSASFAKLHKLELMKDSKAWCISIPTGLDQVATLVCRRCSITLGHLVLPADLIMIDMKEFDIILGMD